MASAGHVRSPHSFASRLSAHVGRLDGVRIITLEAPVLDSTHKIQDSKSFFFRGSAPHDPNLLLCSIFMIPACRMQGSTSIIEGWILQQPVMTCLWSLLVFVQASLALGTPGRPLSENHSSHFLRLCNPVLKGTFTPIDFPCLCWSICSMTCLTFSEDLGPHPKRGSATSSKIPGAGDG